MSRVSKLVILVSLTASSPAKATLLDAIQSLSAGDKYRVVFVTTTTTPATSTDIATYNDIAATDAASGLVTLGLGLTWKALASTQAVNAQVNTGISALDSELVSIFNTAGDLIATSGLDLWDSLISAPVRYDQNGVAVTPGLQWVWTGTRANGQTYTDLELGNTQALAGQFNAVNQSWVSNINFPTATAGAPSFGVYAVSSQATVPRPVPEPSNLVLLLIGWLAYRGSQQIGPRRRQY